MTFICSAMALPSFPELLFECCQYFLRSRHNSTTPPIPAQRHLVTQCQPDILKQLPVRKFDRQNPLQFANVCLYLLCRKWPDCYRTEQPELDALGTCHPYCRFRNAGHRAIRDDRVVGIVHLVLLNATFGLLDLRVFCLEFDVPLLQFSSAQRETGNYICMVTPMSPDRCPLRRLQRRNINLGLELHRFHHLPDETINNNHDYHAVLVRQFKCIDKQVHAFLNREGGKDNAFVVPVATPFDRLEVVRLSGGNVAEARPATHGIHDYTRNIGAGDVGNAFLHQGNAWAGGRRHRPDTCAGSTVNHVDRRNLAFSLHESTTNLRETAAHVLGRFILWRNRVAKIVATSRLDGTFRKGFRPLHENLVAHTFTSLCSSMATSGQTSAHEPQLVHLS